MAVSIMYAKEEDTIYRRLVSAGYNKAAICGILVNLYKDSEFKSNNLQDEYNDDWGIKDHIYTVAINSNILAGKSAHDAYTGEGIYPSYAKGGFSGDGAGYGIAQWSSPDRKAALYNYVKSKNRQIEDLGSQIDFLLSEMGGTRAGASAVRLVSLTLDGAKQAARIFCQEFEGITDEYELYAREYAVKEFWDHYSTKGDIVSGAKGSDVVAKARELLGKEYEFGKDYYSTNNTVDDAGLVYYAYSKSGAIVDMERFSSKEYYNTYKDTATKISDINKIVAGDLLFYPDSTGGVWYIAIANGKGGRIYTFVTRKKVVEEEGIGSPMAILRILSSAEISTSECGSSTSGGGSSSGGSSNTPSYDEGFTSIDPSEYASLTAVDPYSEIIAANLSRVTSEGYKDYGLLVDMTNGGEFIFYVPEFTEQAGANWGDVEIRGRSVNVKSYNYTSSRNITVSLDLYAGVGVYAPKSNESGEDTISRMHRDANFIKSLEYPDYSNAITRPPSTVHLILGSAINIVGVVSDVVVEHLKPIDRYNRSMYIKVNFKVTQTAVNPPDYNDIRKGQYTLVSTEDIDSLSTGDPDREANKAVLISRGAE